MEPDIVNYLKSLGRNSIDFGVSAYGAKLPDLGQIKKNLADAGIKSRFVLPREGTELSSVVVKKQKLVEFLIAGGFTAKTIWVQDFESWNRRDYDRPAVEAHIGMLPPKVARMMVNISQKFSIHDPFCGVGTIVAEAAVLGLNVSGSDIDPDQVARTQKNLEWLGRKAEVFVCDARKISHKVKPVDAIVTEADLGPNDRVKNYELRIKQLHKLYLECFQSWKGMAKKIVIALPDEEIIDKVVAMGYILESGPYIYARPQAKIKRHILVFRNGSY